MTEPTTPAPRFHFYFVSGEIEFRPHKDKALQYIKVNSVHRIAAPNASLSGSSLGAKELGKMQTGLQMGFHQKRSRQGFQPPYEVTDAVITHITFLGNFTEEEFLKGAPTDSEDAETPSEA
jgi:hypothetical protein